MKRLITALVLSFAASSAVAQSVDMSSLFPPLDFPEPTSEIVTQDDTGIDN
ncbi:hypothetical protein [Roseovarius faecimaris]|uniref:hypothetical protein n=1 Tax=Roseovarius faecimaris TaxID=2494550 RepID=UPI0018DF78AB|nr:hypothetical protein [Roseovarius faecimaris]